MGQHRDRFPHQPHRTRLNRRRHRLSDTLTLLRQRLLTLIDYAQDRYCVIDSMPVSVIGFHLVPGAAGVEHWRDHGADFERVTTKKQTIFGYKLHLLVTLTSVIRDFVLTPASANDVAIAPELLGGHQDLVVLGDKGSISAPLAAALREELWVTLLTPLRSNQKPPRDRAFVRMLNGVRQIIETVNDQLTDPLRIGRNQAHTFAGLRARLESKLTAHTLCIHINR